MHTHSRRCGAKARAVNLNQSTPSVVDDRTRTKHENVSTVDDDTFIYLIPFAGRGLPCELVQIGQVDVSHFVALRRLRSSPCFLSHRLALYASDGRVNQTPLRLLIIVSIYALSVAGDYSLSARVRSSHIQMCVVAMS